MLRTAGWDALLRCLLIFSLLGFPPSSRAYSVFTHEQIVDLAWRSLIVPLLLTRFPHSTAGELREAHAYAYGGCVIQDMGYYPFGKEFFSDLTHYVRTGDFIASLLRNARTVDEYAFAIGALSHYVGDNIGHHDAINRAVAASFPKLEKTYGSSVTYDQNPHAHIRTEFAFDVGQLSKHRLAPAAYLNSIGFQVSRRLLEQSFTETYSLNLPEVLGRETPAIRSYRTSVRTLLPKFAYAETILHRHSFPPDAPNPEFEIYTQHIDHTEFAKLWSPYRRKPRLNTYLLAFLIRIVPKIGPVSCLAMKIPTQDTENLYITSVNRSIELYQAMLTELHVHSAVALVIPDRDLDTGEVTRPGAYARTDRTYAKLLRRMTSDSSRPVPRDLQRDILDYYADPTALSKSQRNKKAWDQVWRDLKTLQAMPVTHLKSGA